MKDIFNEITEIAEKYHAKVSFGEKGILIYYPQLGQGSAICSDIEDIFKGEYLNIRMYPKGQVLEVEAR